MWKYILLSVALLAAGSAALARSRSTAPDPFDLNEWGNSQADIYNLPLRYLPGMTLNVLQTVDTGVRNLILISNGQSNITNILPDVTATNNPTKLDNLNIYDGGIYVAGTGAQYGTSGLATQRHPITYVADQLVTNNKFDRVIHIPVSINGSTVARYASGGLYANRIPIALARLKQKGIVPGMTNVTFAIVWGQGESDRSTSQADYVTGFNSMVAVVAAAGFSGRWFVAKQTYFAGTYGAGAQAAQTSLWNAGSPGVINNPAGIYLGANADALSGGVVAADGCRCSGSFNQPCRAGDSGTPGACTITGSNDHWTQAGGISYAVDPTYGWIQAMAASGAPF